MGGNNSVEQPIAKPANNNKSNKQNPLIASFKTLEPVNAKASKKSKEYNKTKDFEGSLAGKLVCAGISVGQSYHEDESLAATLDLLKRHNPESVLWFIADVLQHLNLQIESAYLRNKKDEAIKIATQKGESWFTRNQKTIEETLEKKAKFMRWSDIDFKTDKNFSVLQENFNNICKLKDIEANIDNTIEVVAYLEQTTDQTAIREIIHFCYLQNLYFFFNLINLIKIISSKGFFENSEDFAEKINATLKLASPSVIAELHRKHTEERALFTKNDNIKEKKDKEEDKEKHASTLYRMLLAVKAFLGIKEHSSESLLLDLALEFYEICQAIVGKRLGNFKGRIESLDDKFTKEACLEFAIKDVAGIMTLAMAFKVETLIYPLRQEEPYLSFYRFIEKVCKPQGLEILIIDGLPKEIIVPKKNKQNKSNHQDTQINTNSNNDELFLNKTSAPIFVEQKRSSIGYDPTLFGHLNDRQTQEFISVPPNSPVSGLILGTTESAANTFYQQLVTTITLLKLCPINSETINSFNSLSKRVDDINSIMTQLQKLTLITENDNHKTEPLKPLSMQFI